MRWRTTICLTTAYMKIFNIRRMKDRNKETKVPLFMLLPKRRRKIGISICKIAPLNCRHRWMLQKDIKSWKTMRNLNLINIPKNSTNKTTLETYFHLRVIQKGGQNFARGRIVKGRVKCSTHLTISSCHLQR